MHDKDGQAPTRVLAAGYAVLRSTKADASAAVSKPKRATKKKFGLKWKGEEKQLANERRAIRANGWGGVWERPNCQAHLRLAPLPANGALQCN